MQIVLQIHSLVRWLIVLVALVALVKFAWGWLRGGKFQGMDRGLTAGFSGLMDLQATIGLVYLLVTGFLQGAGFPWYRIAHGLVMFLAVAAGHLPARWKNADDKIRFRNGFFVILVALVLIAIGIGLLFAKG